MFIRSMVILTAFVTSLGWSKTFDSESSLEIGCHFFPPNKLKIPIRPTGQMSETQFRRILQVVQDTYAPIFSQMRAGRFQIVPRWNENDVNAVAYRQAINTTTNTQTAFRRVDIFGGLARHPLITPEGLMIVACHEIGHHLGGSPQYRQQGPENNWASTEGQSDYFATSKCARIVLGRLKDNEEWAKRATVDPHVRVQCQASFRGDAKEAAICMRSSMASLSLARVLGSLSEDWKLIDFRRPDRNVVSSTYEAHPKAQCRLDTYFQGALCRTSALTPFSSRDPRQGACTGIRGSKEGVRPACWYKEDLQSLGT